MSEAPPHAPAPVPTTPPNKPVRKHPKYIQSGGIPRLCNLFSALANPTRMAIILLLHEKGPQIRIHIAAMLQVPEATVASNITTLRNCGIVEAKRGSICTYSLRPEIMAENALKFRMPGFGVTITKE